MLKGNAKVAFAVAKNIKKLSVAHEVKNKARESILTAYAAKNEDGTPLIEGNEYQFPHEEAKAECIQEISDLEQLDSGVELHQISEANIETVKEITANLILRLSYVIVEN